MDIELEGLGDFFTSLAEMMDDFEPDFVLCFFVKFVSKNGFGVLGVLYEIDVIVSVGSVDHI
jgi:hypothetical protein